MGLETATFIHELEPANPVGASDPKSQGDDHFHLLKQTLQNTLPNVEGAVTSSHTELNILDGATLSTAELNLLDGVTATTAELNKVDGVTFDLTTLHDSANLRTAFCRCEANNAANPAYANRNINSITHTNGSGIYTVDYTAAGFTIPPVVNISLQNGALFRFTIGSTTATQTSIQITNNSSVLSDAVFNFMASGY
jgi:hypothetical protein